MALVLAVGQRAPGLGQIIDIKTPNPEEPQKKLVLIALSNRPEGHSQFTIAEWIEGSEEVGWVREAALNLFDIFYKWQEMT